MRGNAGLGKCISGMLGRRGRALNRMKIRGLRSKRKSMR